MALHGPKVGNVVAPGRFHGGELVVRDIGLEPRETAHLLVTREILAEVPAEAARRHEVPRVGARRGRRARSHRRGVPRRRGGVPGRRRLRGGGGAGRVAAGARDAPAGGREAAAGRRLRRRGEGTRACDRPRPRTRRRPPRARSAAARGDGAARRRRRRRAVRARAVRARGAHRADAALRRAGRPARRGAFVGGRPSPGGGRAGRRALRLRLPAEGRRHDRRRSRRRRARLRLGPAVARHGGHGRRPDRDDRRLPREGHGRAARRGGRGHRLRRGGAARPRARPRRLRRRRRVAGRSRAMRSDVTIDLGAVRRNARGCSRRWRAPQLWAVVKADAYGHGAAEVAGAALEAGAAALCVSTVGEGVALRSGLPQARILVLGPCPESDLERVRRAGLELAVSEPPFPEESRPPEARHRHGPLRHGRCAGAAAERRRADEPPRDRRLGPASRSASSSVSAKRPTRAAAGGARREQRCCASFSGSRFSAARCGIALYGLSPFGAIRPRTASSPCSRGAASSPGEAPRRRREHRLRASFRRRAADLDRARAGRLRGRLPARPDRHRGAGRRRAAPRRRHRLDGFVRRRASRAAPAGDAGDARRRRRARRGACARGRHHQLRADRRDSHSPERTQRVFVDA